MITTAHSLVQCCQSKYTMNDNILRPIELLLFTVVFWSDSGHLTECCQYTGKKETSLFLYFFFGKMEARISTWIVLVSQESQHFLLFITTIVSHFNCISIQPIKSVKTLIYIYVKGEENALYFFFFFFVFIHGKINNKLW